MAKPFSEPPASARARTILLVDDGDDSRQITKWFLSNFGFTVQSVRSAEEALALFDSNVHDLVVTDNAMPGMSGAELAHVIKLRSATTPILMFTGKPPENRSALDMVIQRPAPMIALKDAVDWLLARPSR